MRQRKVYAGPDRFHNMQCFQCIFSIFCTFLDKIIHLSRSCDTGWLDHNSPLKFLVLLHYLMSPTWSSWYLEKNAWATQSTSADFIRWDCKIDFHLPITVYLEIAIWCQDKCLLGVNKNQTKTSLGQLYLKHKLDFDEPNASHQKVLSSQVHKTCSHRDGFHWFFLQKSFLVQKTNQTWFFWVQKVDSRSDLTCN